MKNKSEDLRNHLFLALENLAEETKPVEVERVKAIVDIATTVINLAKVEVDFARVTGKTVDGVISIASEKLTVKRIA